MWSFFKDTSLEKKERLFHQKYAERELNLLGLESNSKEYKRIMSSVNALLNSKDKLTRFIEAYYIMQLVSLKPLTNCDHKDFMVDVSAVYQQEPKSVYQCSRCLNHISRDGGKTWSGLIEEKEHECEEDCACKNKKSKVKPEKGFIKHT